MDHGTKKHKNNNGVVIIIKIIKVVEELDITLMVVMIMVENKQNLNTYLIKNINHSIRFYHNSHHLTKIILLSNHNHNLTKIIILSNHNQIFINYNTNNSIKYKQLIHHQIKYTVIIQREFHQLV